MEQKMINYLQAKLTRLNDMIEKYGIEDREVEHRFDELIAQKELVEAMIEQPVNLRKDGNVTVGF